MSDDGGVGEVVEGLHQQRAECRHGEGDDPPIEGVEMGTTTPQTAQHAASNASAAGTVGVYESTTAANTATSL
jgi:hypothetical protein